MLEEPQGLQEKVVIVPETVFFKESMICLNQGLQIFVFIYPWGEVLLGL